MIANFATGGAAVAVLSRAGDARLSVVNLGTVEPLPAAAGVLDLQLAPGSADFTVAPALTPPLLEAALAAGRARVDAAASLFIGGEMGITTSAAAVLAGLLDVAPETAIGRGTGVDAGLARKHEAIAAGLALHAGDWQGLAGPERALPCCRGSAGLIAALAGAFVAAACRRAGAGGRLHHHRRRPGRLCDQPRHARLAAVRPPLGRGRSRPRPRRPRGGAAAGSGHAPGEGSGAVVALSLLRSALVVHADMATFADAGVGRRGRRMTGIATTTIDLLRHAECEGAPSSAARGTWPWPRRAGRAAARGRGRAGLAVGDQLAADPLPGLRRGPGRRARSACGVDARFREMSFGAWEGRPVADVWAEEETAASAWLADPEAHPPQAARRWRRCGRAPAKASTIASTRPAAATV